MERRRQEWDGGILRGGEGGKEIVLLEDEPEIGASEPDPRVGIQLFHRGAEDLHVPEELSSSPAITEIRVVLPHPLGRRRGEFPASAVKLTRGAPRCACRLPELLSKLHRTADWNGSCPEDDGRFQHPGPGAG